MGYIIKPIVTEKMSKLTDKSSLERRTSGAWRMSMVDLQKLLGIGRVQQGTAGPISQYYHFLALDGQQMRVRVGGSHPEKFFLASMGRQGGMHRLFRPMGMHERDRVQEFVRTLHPGGDQGVHPFEGRFGGSTNFQGTGRGGWVSCNVDPPAFGKHERQKSRCVHICFNAFPIGPAIRKVHGTIVADAHFCRQRSIRCPAVAFSQTN